MSRFVDAGAVVKCAVDSDAIAIPLQVGRWHQTINVTRPVDRFRFRKTVKGDVEQPTSHARVGDNDHGVHGRTWGGAC